MIQNFLNLSDEKLKEIDYMIERLEKDHPLMFTRLEKDLCEAVMEVKPEMLNFYEMVYGGQTYNLMDVVAGVANICGGGYGPTVSGNVEYVSGTKGQKELRAVGRVRRNGRTFSYIDVDVLGTDGRLVSKGSFIYYNMASREDRKG